MLRCQPPLIQFSSSRRSFHDGMWEEYASLDVDCFTCGSALSENLLTKISEGEKWYRGLDQPSQVYLSEIFGLKHTVEGPNRIPYARLPDGGLAYFCPILCLGCSTTNIAVVEFYELQPARYIAKLQGFAGCERYDQST